MKINILGEKSYEIGEKIDGIEIEDVSNLDKIGLGYKFDLENNIIIKE